MKRSTIIFSMISFLFALTLTASAQVKSVKKPTASLPASLVENQNLAGSVRVRQSSLTSILNPSSFANRRTGRETVNKTSSQQLVQGNQIGTSVRPRRNGLSGDFNSDGNVDAADYVMRSSGENQKSTTRSLTAGTYGRGRQNSLTGLLIPQANKSPRK